METYNPKDLGGIQEMLKDLFADALQNALEGELEGELGYSKYDYRKKDTTNSRNGYSKKTIESSFGEFELDIPRDRDGEFEPQIIRKNQTKTTNELEEKIISMYAKGMTTSDIESHLNDIYGIEVSDTLISKVTDKILPTVKKRELELMQVSVEEFQYKGL